MECLGPWPLSQALAWATRGRARLCLGAALGWLSDLKWWCHVRSQKCYRDAADDCKRALLLDVTTPSIWGRKWTTGTFCQVVLNCMNFRVSTSSLGQTVFLVLWCGFRLSMFLYVSWGSCPQAPSQNSHVLHIPYVYPCIYYYIHVRFIEFIAYQMYWEQMTNICQFLPPI